MSPPQLLKHFRFNTAKLQLLNESEYRPAQVEQDPMLKGMLNFVTKAVLFCV